MKNIITKLSIWVVTEGLRGTENQCLGVAEALGITPTIKTIGLKQPWRALSPYLGFECAHSFTGDTLDGPYPDIVIAAGRKAISALRYIKRKSYGKTFCVYIQDPRVKLPEADIIALPKHDKRRGQNVFVTKATPNRITQKKLQDGVEAFPAFKKLNAPRIAVLIGGESNAYSFPLEYAQKLTTQLLNVVDKHKASLMVTASRRTPPDVFQHLKDTLKGKNIYFWDESGENPYFGMLGWADVIMATSDSASMLSEAGTTGKPVYMIDLKYKLSKPTRLTRLQDNLIKLGILRRFEGKFETWTYDPLNDSQAIAAKIKKYLPTRAENPTK